MSITPEGCSVIVHDPHYRILVQLRDEHAEFNPSVHALFGGGLKPGEDPRDGAMRELQEEIDLRRIHLTYIGLNHGRHHLYSQRVSAHELDRLSGLKPREGAAAVIITEKTINDFQYAPTHKGEIESFWERSRLLQQLPF